MDRRGIPSTNSVLKGVLNVVAPLLRKGVGRRLCTVH